MRNKIYIILEELDTISNKSKNAILFNIENFCSDIIVRQLGYTKLEIQNAKNQVIYLLDDLLTNDYSEIVLNHEIDIKIEEADSRFVLLSKINFGIYNYVVTYDVYKKEMIFTKILFNIIEGRNDIEINIKSRNMITIKNRLSDSEKNIYFNRIKKRKPKKVFDEIEVEKFGEVNILTIFVLNKRRYYVYLQRNGVFIAKSNAYRVTRHKANLKIFGTKNHFFLFGRFGHSAYNAEMKFDYLYVLNTDHMIAKFKRPFRKIKLLKYFGYFKIPISSLNNDDRIHSNLFVGSRDKIIHNLKFKYSDKKVKTYIFRRYQGNLVVIRTNLQGNITTTTIPFAEEYTSRSRIKIQIAKIISKLFKKQNYNVNLYFEKKSNKDDESGFRVFEKVMSDVKHTKSKNYFILNKDSSHYQMMKKKYGKSIIEKYSFKHYLSIYNANYFISSELSNHVLNDRLYIDSLRNKIMTIPLVFLQHGIMFAKPVDNPMAFGFHKDKNLYNMYKSVISSPLEAGEFFKMNYDEEDLILTGLATLDYAKLAKDADRIAFMPTYRYWEESLIYHNNIEETTYYKTIIKIIKSFQSEGLLNKLLIVPHNKFSEHIYENMPEYRDIICDNPSEALKISKIFITDYSSAIYDAIYRGAYPIFYWEEKDYLINQYKAIPPVNEDNAPGPVVYNVNELINAVQHAISKNYLLEDIFKEKYLKINIFNDNKNSERIVQFLQNDGII
ncbi:CDP-glycerol glycerophosphotransferase family protein [Heyndrickxia sporothermodurans]|uniref:CDP-glycerol glycerophosphotransferase family protein n=1 Tax=Heyndrickxia sporothermodurans TaxID=46224 RepID=UPI001F372292|nr:CDP-glycerol glycerophosphotransferase family protein [Heyndrickxia sporothermodurans]